MAGMEEKIASLEAAVLRLNEEVRGLREEKRSCIQNGVVRVRLLELVDDAGRVMARLGTDDDDGSGYLRFIDADENPLVRIESDECGGLIELGGKEGGTAVSLCVLAEGEGSVQVFDASSEGGVHVSVNAFGSGQIVTTSREGGHLVEIHATEGGGRVTTLDGQGGELVRLSMIEGGGGSVTIDDGSGTPLGQLAGGHLALMNSAGAAVFVAGQDDDGDGWVELLKNEIDSDGDDEESRCRVRLGVNGPGDGFVETFSGAGHQAVCINATPAKEGCITTFNEKGHEIALLSTTTSGNATLALANARGEAMIHLGGTTEGAGGIRVAGPGGTSTFP